MKKRCGILIILLLVFLLAGCQKTLHGTNEVLETVRAEIPLTGAQTVELRYAGFCAKDGKALIWFVSGNEYQAHGYFPAECEIVGRNEYKFVRLCKPMERGMDIAVLQWLDGYAFLINDPNCVAVRIVDSAGERIERIEKDCYPYVFYHDLIPTEYEFLDAQGTVLS